MTKRIDIEIEVEENEDSAKIADIIAKALKDFEIDFIAPVMILENKRTEFENILDKI